MIPILEKCAGLKNNVDPLDFSDSKYLKECRDVRVTKNGHVEVIPGMTSHITSFTGCHSGYCNGGDAFVARDRETDAAIYRLAADGRSATLVISGLTKGARVSFWQEGDKTYYMNGHESGVITAGVSSAWPGYRHVGVNRSRQFYPAPIGTHICVFDGRMWIIVDDAIYCSEVYAYGKFRLSGRGFPLSSAGRMIKPVSGGVWVSDSTQTAFIAKGEKFADMAWTKKDNYPAHEWSECIELVSLAHLDIPGLSAIWSSDRGLMVGTADGTLLCLTDNNLIYPSGSNAATVYDDRYIINTVGY